MILHAPKSVFVKQGQHFVFHHHHRRNSFGRWDAARLIKNPLMMVGYAKSTSNLIWLDEAFFVMFYDEFFFLKLDSIIICVLVSSSSSEFSSLYLARHFIIQKIPLMYIAFHIVEVLEIDILPSN